MLTYFYKQMNSVGGTLIRSSPVRSLGYEDVVDRKYKSVSVATSSPNRSLAHGNGRNKEKQNDVGEAMHESRGQQGCRREVPCELMFVLTDVSQCRLWTLMTFKRRDTTVTTLQERACLVGFGAVFFFFRTNVVFLTSCIFWKCNSLFSASMRYRRSYNPFFYVRLQKHFIDEEATKSMQNGWNERGNRDRQLN